ncbi:MAG: S8 family serine peptidase [bacterium]
MKKLIVFIVITLVAGCLNANSKGNTEAGKLIIKLKETSEYYKIIKTQNDYQIHIKELDGLLGKTSVSPYLNIKLIAKSEKKTNNLLSVPKAKKYNLSALLLVNYSSAINPEIAAKKLQYLDFIEYIEPVYKYEFCYHPNDSMLGQQYYLDNVRAFDAWDVIKASNLPDSQKVVIGIIDTGVDFYHPDLRDNLYINPGEDGLDKDNNSKRDNGIDDDGNGYIDDWCGWDFVSADGPDGDNLPLPGNAHGTHVAGTCAAVQNNVGGIAGTAIHAKFLPVKIGKDDVNSRSIENGMDGILYAAVMGCDVINCSWGGTGFSKAAQEVIWSVTDMGSLIIAAAGNDGQDSEFYPAAYDGVYSVSATDMGDTATSFTNYNFTVDVAAPGYHILSTIPFDNYDAWNGTSMASPIVSGVAAMIRLMKPELSPIEAGEVLKVSSDNIDSLNPYYYSKLGFGRVNAYNALSRTKFQSINVKNIQIKDEDGNGSFMPNERMEVYFDVLNILDSIGNLKVRVRSNPSDFLQIDFDQQVITVGDLASKQYKQKIGPISFTLPENTPYNYPVEVDLMFFDSKEYKYETGFNLVANQTYMTFAKNDLLMTITSSGNVGYNDYPNNVQGFGCIFNDTKLLFEGGLMVGRGIGRISDAVRNDFGESANRDFYIKDRIHIIDSNDTKLVSNCSFNDNELGKMGNDLADISIDQTNFQYNLSDVDNVVFVQFDIVNDGRFTDSLFLSYFFDWDIGIRSEDDRCLWDKTNQYGVFESIGESKDPLVGVKMLSNHRVNFFPMDNESTDEKFPGIYDGFTQKEKWLTMTNGILRDSSKVNDASMIIGAGPISLRNNDTTRVTFAIFAAESRAKLDETSTKCAEFAKTNFINEPGYEAYVRIDAVKNIFPNPSYTNDMKVYFALKQESDVNFKLYDFVGKEVYSKSIEGLGQGRHYVTLTPENIAPGAYVLVIESKDLRISKKVIFVK